MLYDKTLGNKYFKEASWFISLNLGVKTYYYFFVSEDEAEKFLKKDHDFKVSYSMDYPTLINAKWREMFVRRASPEIVIKEIKEVLDKMRMK